MGWGGELTFPKTFLPRDPPATVLPQAPLHRGPKALSTLPLPASPASPPTMPTGFAGFGHHGLRSDFVLPTSLPASELLLMPFPLTRHPFPYFLTLLTPLRSLVLGSNVTSAEASWAPGGQSHPSDTPSEHPALFPATIHTWLAK